MQKTKMWLAALLAVAGAAQAQGPRAEVIHWWTSGGESAAVRTLADRYRAGGGVWVDTAIAGGEQARSVVINRIMGGTPPTAAQFNTSSQFRDIVDQGLLNNVDAIAKREQWDRALPEALLSVIRIQGHYYAIPIDIHMPAWIWYSKAAFKKAGIAKEPQNVDELFAALDKLKAAGLIPLAHGGQSWQEHIVFMRMLADAGGRDLYFKVLRDRDQRAIASPQFRKVLLAFKRLQSYVDSASPGRNWNDATALLISGKAGVQIMGDWAKGELTAAHLKAGKDFGCLPGLGPQSLYLIQGDVFVFPRTSNAEALKAQQVLANVIVAPATQIAFNSQKGGIPPRADIDARSMDMCAQAGMAIMHDKSRQAGFGEVYLTPDQNGALFDILTAFWNGSMNVDKAQQAIAAALRD
ncbi:MAG TPA: ABC transporter substrate-binding protein [Telluria sp.]|nr:ABC transporter substrate-binding protein [Telluria sp.]